MEFSFIYTFNNSDLTSLANNLIQDRLRSESVNTRTSIENCT